MWMAGILAFVGITMLLIPQLRRNEKVLPMALIAVFIAAWLDKGIGLVLGGFVPNPFGRVTEYIPTPNEIAIIIGIYAIGLFLLTILYKVVVGVRQTGIGYEH
jgi:molybdopterin-containing oxidoreductase family membrane subunit